MDLARYLLFKAAPLRPAPMAPVRPKTFTLKAAELDRLAGRYRFESGSALAIARRDDHLLVDSLGGGISTFFPARPQDFFSNTEDEQISFVLEGGRITGLVSTAGSRSNRPCASAISEPAHVRTPVCSAACNAIGVLWANAVRGTGASIREFDADA